MYVLRQGRPPSLKASCFYTCLHSSQPRLSRRANKTTTKNNGGLESYTARLKLDTGRHHFGWSHFSFHLVHRMSRRQFNHTESSPTNIVCFVFARISQTLVQDPAQPLPLDAIQTRLCRIFWDICYGEYPRFSFLGSKQPPGRASRIKLPQISSDHSCQYRTHCLQG